MSFGAQIRVVAGKELRDAIRDRRSILSALIIPLAFPVMIGFMFNAMASLRDSERPLEVPIVGAEQAPNLIAFLEERGLIVEEAPADPEAAVRASEQDVVLKLDAEYSEDFRAARPAGLVLIYDASKTATMTTIQRLRLLLREYNNSVAALRLMARGVSPSLVQVVSVDSYNLATPAQLAARFLGMIPMFLIMVAFMAAMNVAIDATAGERERLSLEPLLVNPVDRLAVTVGKWLVATAFSTAGITIMLPAFVLAMSFVPLEQMDLELALGWRQLVWMMVLLLPMSLLASAMQMTVATFARSFKEAQTYVGMLIFVPMIPGFVTVITPLDTQMWMYAVPALAQQQLLLDVIGGEAVDLIGVSIAWATSVGLAFALVVITARLLQSERIVFGR